MFRFHISFREGIFRQRKATHFRCMLHQLYEQLQVQARRTSYPEGSPQRTKATQLESCNALRFSVHMHLGHFVHASGMIHSFWSPSKPCLAGDTDHCWFYSGTWHRRNADGMLFICLRGSIETGIAQVITRSTSRHSCLIDMSSYAYTHVYMYTY